MAPTYYEVLEVSQDASTATIKSAVNKMAKATHIDKVGPSAHEAFVACRAAYEVSIDPTPRPAYDDYLKYSHNPFTDSRDLQRPRPQMTPPSSPRRRQLTNVFQRRKNPDKEEKSILEAQAERKLRRPSRPDKPTDLDFPNYKTIVDRLKRVIDEANGCKAVMTSSFDELHTSIRRSEKAIWADLRRAEQILDSRLDQMLNEERVLAEIGKKGWRDDRNARFHIKVIEKLEGGAVGLQNLREIIRADVGNVLAAAATVDPAQTDVQKWLHEEKDGKVQRKNKKEREADFEKDDE